MLLQLRENFAIRFDKLRLRQNTRDRFFRRCRSGGLVTIHGSDLFPVCSSILEC